MLLNIRVFTYFFETRYFYSHVVVFLLNSTNVTRRACCFADCIRCVQLLGATEESRR